MIRVMIVDDHNIVREGLRNVLEKLEDITVVEDADNGRAALEAVERASPDVILMDMSMPVMNGIEATQMITTLTPHPKVVILSMHKDFRLVSQALKAGARGYILKDSGAADLLRGVRAVAQGEYYLCQPILEVVIERFVKGPPDSPGQSDATLTPREREILQLIAEGKNAKGIAFLLNLNPKTVDTHRQQIMKKLKLRSVAELTRYAIREGMTGVES